MTTWCLPCNLVSRIEAEGLGFRDQAVEEAQAVDWVEEGLVASCNRCETCWILIVKHQPVNPW